MTRTDFLPRINGFAFRNSFQFTDSERDGIFAAVTPTIDAALGNLGPFGLVAHLPGVRDALGRIAFSAIPQRYGLCGGIVFATLDYYGSPVAIPRRAGPEDQPPPGSALRGYLWGRLLDSWRLNGVTFLEWKARLHLLPKVWPFDAGPRSLRDRSRTEWKTLQARLGDGRPVPLGLVGELVDPFQDHQVLAYGCDPAGDDRGTIFVYDCNCPDVEQTIAFDLSGDMLRATESCGRPGNPLRGFFCETYEPAPPLPVS